MLETASESSIARPHLPVWIYEAFVRTASEAIIVVDHEGVIQLWNHGAEQLFGYAPAEMLGAPLDAIIPERLRAAHNAGFRRAVDSGTTKYQGKVMNTRAVHKNGTKLYVDLSFSLLIDREGRVAAVAAVGRDSTERYRAEAKAQRAT